MYADYLQYLMQLVTLDPVQVNEIDLFLPIVYNGAC